MRPAVVLADTGRGDYLLCQVTSKPYADQRAIQVMENDFKEGSLKVVSYARPGKLFTANQELIFCRIGQLHDSVTKKIITAVIGLLNEEGT